MLLVLVFVCFSEPAASTVLGIQGFSYAAAAAASI